MSRRRSLVELFTLCGFALAQPLLSVFGRTPDQFTFRAATSWHIIGFGLAAVLLPCLVLWGVELIAGFISDEMRLLLHRVLVISLVGIIVVQLLPRSLSRNLAIAFALIVGGLALLARERFSAVRLWLTYAVVGPVGFLLLFLLTSPTSGLLFPNAPMAEISLERRPPVVLVILDELPLESLITAEGELAAELYPNLAALAGDAHWFRNATSVSPLTRHALPAILTGRLPAGDGLHLANTPENLFTLLGGAYELNVHETVTRLCPPSACAAPPTSEVARNLWADARHVLGYRLRVAQGQEDPVALFPHDRAPFDELVDGISGASATLHALHVLLPHEAFEYLPDGTRYPPRPDLDGRADEGGSWGQDEWLPTLYRQRHLAQTMFVDELLGSVFDRLRDQGIYDDALIVVTADHGMSFRPGETSRALDGEPLNTAITPDLLSVPFFVKEPGQREGTVDDRNVLGVDVLPTIADVLGIELPWPVDGQSALGPPRSTNEKPWFGVVPGTATNRVAEEVTVDGQDVWPGVLERSVDSILPPDGGRDRLWRVGPHSELLGLRASDLGDRLQLIESHLVDPELMTESLPPGVAPALIEAETPGLDPGESVAVVVDGRVAATGPAFPIHGRVEVAVLVPAELVARTSPTIELFRIR